MTDQLPDAETVSTSRKGWWIGGIIIVVVVLAVPVILVTTVITNAFDTDPDASELEGSDSSLSWTNYPGVAPDAGAEEIDALEAPSAEKGLKDGEEMIAEIEKQISDEFDYEWSDGATEDGEDTGEVDTTFPLANNYGGESMLVSVTAPASFSDGIPASWSDKQKILGIMEDVAADYDYSAATFDSEGDPSTEVIVTGVLPGTYGQFLSFSFVDYSLDTGGDVAGSLGDDAESGITLSYGATALLPKADRDAYKKAIAAYDGLERPAPIAD